MKNAYSAGSLIVALVIASPARAVDEAKVKAAVERGVAYLRVIQRPDGTWYHHQGPPGATALAALTLLECGVSPTDAQIQRAADAVRTVAIDLSQTYGIATSILFLDRLHDSRDDYLIQMLALRMLRGQQVDGSWGYECAAASQEEKTALLKKLNEIRGQAGSDTSARPAPKLPDEINEQIAALRKRQPFSNRPDNSNTQFAAMALWVARRRGIPSEDALVRIGKHFEATQLIDHGWQYITPQNLLVPDSLPGPTCAGLIGLAIGHVSRQVTLRTRRAPETAAAPLKHMINDNPYVHGGLAYLGLNIGVPNSQKIAIDPENRAQKYFYCTLWSIERVATAYGLKTIGGKDWYAWGASRLLASQEQDGSWQGDLKEGGVDTSFALLFLTRSNLVRDLSDALKGQIKDKQVALKAKGAAKQPKIALGPQAGVDSGGRPISDLCVALLNVPANRQIDLIHKYRDEKGGEYTQALAEASAMLEGDMRQKARDALRDRLTRMSADTLRRELGDDDPEIRAAAALAAGMKDDKNLVGDLIFRLNDRNPRVERAAYTALTSLTGRDFGPSANATPEERRRAFIQWRNWYNQNGR
jgi:hypothetical protein